MTHIWISKVTVIGSDNGFSPSRHQAIIWTNAGTLLIGPIDWARNGNSGCANEILGCAKCHFWWKSPWKWNNLVDFRVCNKLNCPCKTQVHGWLAKTMIGPLETNFSEISIKILIFLFKDMYWKCLENVGHFVLASMCSHLWGCWAFY